MLHPGCEQVWMVTFFRLRLRCWLFFAGLPRIGDDLQYWSGRWTSGEMAVGEKGPCAMALPALRRSANLGDEGGVTILKWGGVCCFGCCCCWRQWLRTSVFMDIEWSAGLTWYPFWSRAASG